MESISTLLSIQMTTPSHKDSPITLSRSLGKCPLKEPIVAMAAKTCPASYHMPHATSIDMFLFSMPVKAALVPLNVQLSHSCLIGSGDFFWPKAY